MSRIGLTPVEIMSGCTVMTEENSVVVQGSKGTITIMVPSGIAVQQQNGNIIVSRLDDAITHRASHGTIRALLANAMVGVSQGWSKSLELVGVGYRAQTNGTELTLHVGFSHPVIIRAPSGVQFAVAENTITITGVDKKVVGETSAHIRSIRPPEPYKGKGIRYVGEQVRKKAGKSAKTTTAAA